MIKFLQTIFLLYILSVLIIAQPEPAMVRIDFPEYVLSGTNFEVSAIFKFSDEPKNSFKLNFIKTSEINITSAFLLFENNRNPILMNISKNDPSLFSISINLDRYYIEDNIPYQIIFICNVNQINKLSNDAIIFKSSLSKSSSLVNQNVIGFVKNEIDFYKYQETAGSNLVFNEKSTFDINYLNKDETKPIYLELWVKSDGSFDKLLNIFDVNSLDTLFTFSKSKFGFFSTQMDDNHILCNDVYLPNSTWNYIGIRLSQKFNDIYIETFVNSQLACTKKILNKSIKKLIKFSFQNSGSNKNINIDRMRLSKFGNNLNLAFEHKHFLNFEADSSKLITQFNFDEKSELTNFKNSDGLSLKYQNILYNKSTAPIFSRAPKLTVNIGSSYNSIVWYVQEYYAAKEFVLEKTSGNNSFKNVFRSFADDDPLKIYYYTDDIITDDEVAYYRLKQINKDGSEVYSAEVKIGNKTIEEFKLRQNYPNPFNPITSIYVDVIVPSELEVCVYDLVGNKVSQLHNGYLTEGLHIFEFNGSNLPSGIYFYEALSPKSHIVKKMILAK